MGTGLYEHFDDGGVAALAGEHERSHSFVVASIYAGVVGEEESHHVLVPLLGGPHQGRRILQIGLIHHRPVEQQRLNDREFSEVTRLDECRGSPNGRSVGERPPIEQGPDDFEAALLTCDHKGGYPLGIGKVDAVTFSRTYQLQRRIRGPLLDREVQRRITFEAEHQCPVRGGRPSGAPARRRAPWHRPSRRPGQRHVPSGSPRRFIPGQERFRERVPHAMLPSRPARAMWIKWGNHYRRRRVDLPLFMFVGIRFGSGYRHC
mmetsp:Transcript_20983/g.50559  ORF Transcript_20983/g.50559 Transcript_20983/m.50559 type:complete len:262 (-) Transcript_20983:1281-2066(-)